MTRDEALEIYVVAVELCLDRGDIDRARELLMQMHSAALLGQAQERIADLRAIEGEPPSFRLH